MEKRIAYLSELPFPVFGLPDSYLGLHLGVVIPVGDWSMVRLEYFPEGGSHSAYVVVSTYNLAEYPDYPKSHLNPLSSASATRDSLGDVLAFGQGGAGILLQALPDRVDASAEQIAGALVRVN